MTGLWEKTQHLSRFSLWSSNDDLFYLLLLFFQKPAQDSGANREQQHQKNKPETFLFWLGKTISLVYVCMAFDQLSSRASRVGFYRLLSGSWETMCFIPLHCKSNLMLHGLCRKPNGWMNEWKRWRWELLTQVPESLRRDASRSSVKSRRILSN